MKGFKTVDVAAAMLENIRRVKNNGVRFAAILRGGVAGNHGASGIEGTVGAEKRQSRAQREGRWHGNAEERGESGKTIYDIFLEDGNGNSHSSGKRQNNGDKLYRQPVGRFQMLRQRAEARRESRAGGKTNVRVAK